MRVIQITDADCKALLNELSLAKFSDCRPSVISPEEHASKELMAAVHSRFHYHVVTWMQNHGAILR